MMGTVQHLTRLSKVFASILAVSISVIVPAGYFLIGHAHLKAVLETEAHMTSVIISRIISANPQYWRYEHLRIEELLTDSTLGKDVEIRNVIDNNNVLIANNGVKVSSPRITISHGLFDSGASVGKIVIQASLIPLLGKTAFVGIFSILCGLMIFVALTVFPLRALSAALQALYDEKEFSQALIDCMPGIFCLIDGKMKARRWNKNVEAVLGYSAQEITSRNPLDLIAPQDREIVNAMIQEVFAGGKAVAEAAFASKNRGEIPYLLTGVRIELDGAPYLLGIGMDIAGRKRLEAERETLIAQLRDALSQVKTLSGMLPICALCKKIRDDKGYWSGVETYITGHSEVFFSHGICPECEKKAYAELEKLKQGST